MPLTPPAGILDPRIMDTLKRRMNCDLIFQAPVDVTDGAGGMSRTWQPIVTPRNLVVNPQFDFGASPGSGWNAYWWPGGAPQAILSIDAAAAPPVGTRALRLQWNASTNGWEGISSAAGIPVPAGPVTISLYAKGAVGGENLQLYWADPNNNTAGFVLTNAWARYSFTVNPETAGTYPLFIRSGPSASWWVTGIMIEASATLDPYSYGEGLGAIEALSSVEKEGQAAAGETSSHLISFAYFPGVDPTMRIVFGARVFDIVSVTDYNEQHLLLGAMVLERFRK